MQTRLTPLAFAAASFFEGQGRQADRIRQDGEAPGGTQIVGEAGPAIGKQSSIRGDDGTAKLQGQAAVKIEP